MGTIAAPALDDQPPERSLAARTTNARPDAPAEALRPVAPIERPSRPPRASSPPPEPVPARPLVDPGTLSSWETIVGVLTDTKPALGALLKHAVPQRIDTEVLELSFPPGSFYGKQAESADAKNAIAHVAERRLGAKPRIEILYGAPSGGTLAQIEDERERARLDATRKKALNHPVVQEALRVFETSPGAVEVRVDVDETG